MFWFDAVFSRSRSGGMGRSSAGIVLRTDVFLKVFPSFGANDMSDGLRQQPCNQAVVSAVCTDSSTWVDGWLKAVTDQNPRTGTARSPLHKLPPSIGPRSASGRPARQHRRHASVSLLSQHPRLRHSLRYGSSSVTARSGAGSQYVSTHTRRLRRHVLSAVSSVQIHGSSRTMSGQSSCGPV